MNNTNLNNARKEKNDEFYTLLKDIEKELVFYKDQFENKVVYCNCDNPDESNFYLYFKNNFADLKLKKLICSCCISNKDSFYCVYDGKNETRNKFEDDLFYTNGDFRSQECINLLKQSDIVVTNPPFSLFKEFISLIVKYDKKFIVLGTINVITYKNIFPLVKNNKMFLGVSIHSGSTYFKIPYFYGNSNNIETINNEKYIGLSGVRWFTNIDLKLKREFISLSKHYNEKDYPMYENFNAIEVGETKNIPIDYDGYMGVPITFLDKYNPEQFEIIDIAKNGVGEDILRTKIYTKEDYSNYNELNVAPVLNENGVLKIKYTRILIRKRNEQQPIDDSKN